MRPTGRLHLGHYHGALKQWVELQEEYECYYFVADWHALTTAYQDTVDIEINTYEMLIDWLACGVSPNVSTIFLQSKVPEHAELQLLLSMITPLPWLERVPNYKDTIARLNDRNLNTFGFLGYPVIMAADILMYRGAKVPVGADNVAHVEVSRDIARRFNSIFGKDDEWQNLANKAIDRLPRKIRNKYREMRKQYVEQGDDEILERARAFVAGQPNLSVDDTSRLIGYLEDQGRIILREPEVTFSETPLVPGLNGEKMSKSYNNSVQMREESGELERKIKTMMTDPARATRKDPGNPKNCPVFELHKIYSEDDTREWASQGCQTAAIGCIDCKGPLIDSMQKEQNEFRERAEPYIDDPSQLRNILEKGSEKARIIARDTLEDVREAMGIAYR